MTRPFSAREHAARRRATRAVLDDVAAERVRQFARYGSNSDLMDGTGPTVRWLWPISDDQATDIQVQFREDYEWAEQHYGKPTWCDLVREEVAESFQESDPGRLREELLQVAALAVSWVETLDARRLASGPHVSN